MLVSYSIAGVFRCRLYYVHAETFPANKPSRRDTLKLNPDEQAIIDAYNERCKQLKPFIYLPLFYLIPDEIATKRGFLDFPRDPYVVATDNHWQKIYYSKQFQVMLLDTWGWMMWQHLGIRGGIDNYSKSDPFVLMALNLPMWAWLLAHWGITTDFLAEVPPGAEIPFYSMDEAATNCDQFAKGFWNHPYLKMREVWEVVNTHRDHRDFSHVASHVKMDFHRKYYHTRASTKVEPIISDYGEDGEEETIYAPYMPNEFAEVEFRIWFEGFLERLNEKDRQIIKLLEEGYNQEEIADMLGYANHSGVSKRVRHIRKEYDKYKREKG